MTEVDGRKTVLITGCAPGGIGHSLALAFHERGLRVFATARKTEQLTSLSEKGIETLSLVVDNDESIVSCKEAVERLTEGRGLDYLGQYQVLKQNDIHADNTLQSQQCGSLVCHVSS